MNLPNKITIIRVILIPIYMLFAFPLDFLPDLGFMSKYRLFFALFIFIVASITDSVDGHIARKYNMVTDFGKFLDPIADKLLVTAALLAITMVPKFGKYYLWATMIILTREFAVTGMRLVAASTGTVIAAGMAGKIKTTSQCIALITLQTAWAVQEALSSVRFFSVTSEVLFWIGNIGLIFAVFMTIYSGIEYFVKNAGVFKKGTM